MGGNKPECERGLSPVVGVALMVVVVVLLAVVTAGMLLDFESELADPAPVVASEESITVELQGNDTEHTLEFVHRGGEAVSVDPLQVQVGSGSASQTIDLDRESAPPLDDGTWTVGERLRLDLDESAVCRGGGGTAAVSLLYAGQERYVSLSERTVPVRRGQFVIEGDAVRPTTTFTANVTFLGTGWSSPTYDARVNVSVRVNGTEVTAWEGIRDTNHTVGSYDIAQQDAGTTLSVAAWGEDGYGNWRTTSESANSEYLTVLRDGDPVPNFDAGAGQQDAAAYADPFIDNGTVVLNDNQAIYLFDFNRQGTDHETADYQDAVVLVSFFSQETATPEVHRTQDRSVIICPAETTGGNATGG